MNIVINQENIQVSDNASLKLALQERNINTQAGVAVAVNNQVIKKTEWENFLLKEGDNIIIINAVCGG